MPSYSPSTIARIGDIKDGLFVETGGVEYDVWGEKVNCYPFTVYNRCIIHALFAEVTETIAGAVQVVFNYIQDTPSIAVQALSTTTTSLNAYVPGSRLSYVPGSVGATAIVSALGAYSWVTTSSATILGVTPLAGVQSVGRIGFLSDTTDATDGTLQFGVLYTPLDKGAYIEALL